MFECHITIEPVLASRLKLVERLAKSHNFRPAKLLMQNRETGTPERSMYDTFLTGHGMNFSDLEDRMIDLCYALSVHGCHVWRYKIEEIKLDSRDGDFHFLLSATSKQPPKEPQ